MGGYGYRLEFIWLEYITLVATTWTTVLVAYHVVKLLQHMWNLQAPSLQMSCCSNLTKMAEHQDSSASNGY